MGEPASSQGEPVRRVQGALQDVSESKAVHERLSSLGEQLSRLNRELSSRVEERTRELEIVNAELKGFAHALAHDLKAPLAAIHGYSAAMEDALASGNTERTKQFASRIRAGGQRMARRLSVVWVDSLCLVSGRPSPDVCFRPKATISRLCDSLR